MKRGLIFTAFFILLVLTVFVYAAGSSTIPQANSSRMDKVNKTDKTTKTDCESFSMRKERIKCRLQNRSEYEEDVDYNVRVPEACRTLRNPTACIAIYKNVQSRGCYKLDSEEKDSCLKRAVNITRARLSELPNQERVQKSREYLVLLLYELQERIEKGQEDGSINTDKAAEIIDLIDEIKQDILNEKRRAEILPKLNDLKQKIREIRN